MLHLARSRFNTTLAIRVYSRHLLSRICKTVVYFFFTNQPHPPSSARKESILAQAVGRLRKERASAPGAPVVTDRPTRSPSTPTTRLLVSHVGRLHPERGSGNSCSVADIALRLPLFPSPHVGLSVRTGNPVLYGYFARSAFGVGCSAPLSPCTSEPDSPAPSTSAKAPADKHGAAYVGKDF